jgi:hypothetical protein
MNLLKTKLFLVTISCLALLCMGCSSKNEDNNKVLPNPHSSQPPGPGNSDNKPESGTGDPLPVTDDKAKEAFLKSYVAGNKKWQLSNVVVNFTERNSKDDSIKEEWTASCVVKDPMLLEGHYPTVSFNLGEFDCGPAHKPTALVALYLISSNMTYQAIFRPAPPSAPNQFMLILADTDSSGYFHWESVQQLNAHTSDHFAVFDFLGKDRRNEFIGDDVYYFDITILQDPIKSRETLEMNYSLNSGSFNTSTTVKVTAELQHAD